MERKTLGLLLCYLVLLGNNAICSSKDDSIRIDILNLKAWENRRVQNDSAKIYARKAIKLSKESGLKISFATAYNRLGLAFFCSGSDLDSANYYFDLALKLRKQYAPVQDVAQVLNNLALVSKTQLEYDSAKTRYRQAIDLLDSSNDAALIAKINGNLATTYGYTGEYDKSLTLFKQNLIYSKHYDDTARWASTCLDLSNIYGKVLDFKAKLKYARRAFDFFGHLADEIGQGKSVLSMGSAQLELGLVDSATANLSMARDLVSKYNIDYLEAKALGNLGKCQYYQGNISRAIESNMRALSLLSMSNKAERALIYLDLGILHKELNQEADALNFYRKAFRLVKTQMPLRKLETARQLELLYSSNGEIDSAFFYGQVVRTLNDTLSRNTTRVYLLEKKLSAQKAAQDKILNEQLLEKERFEKNKMKYYLLFLISASLLVFAFMRNRIRQKRRILAQKNELLQKETELLEQEKAFRKQDQILKENELAHERALRKQEQEIKEKELELERNRVDELLKTQELSSIMNVLEVQENERKRIAQDLHDKLGSMLSVVKLHFKKSEKNIERLQQQNRDEYKKANKLLDDACDEVRKIAHNLVSGVLRKFGLVAALEDLKTTIEQSEQLEVELLDTGMDERLNWDYELNLYRIIQELLSNTMKHAKANEVSIQLLRNNGNLNIVYQDNGRGFSLEKIQYGLGMKNIESRLDRLNGKMEIDTGKGGGSTFTIDILISTDEEDKSFVSG